MLFANFFNAVCKSAEHVRFESNGRAASRKQLPKIARRCCGRREILQILARRANHFRFTEIMSSPKIKNISLLTKVKSGHISAHPVLLRRASAVVTDVGRVAVDADVAKTNATIAYGEVVWSWRPVAGVKPVRGQTPITGDGGKKARSPGRARYKP